MAPFVRWRSDMRARRLTLLIGLYVCLDFASPFIPGAFSFNPDESVEGVSAHRRAVKVTVVAIASPAPKRAQTEAIARVAPPRPQSRPLGEWLIALRRAHSPTAATPLISEDH
jgi:hypothetical protein